MAKGKECFLIINTASGYCLPTTKHPSISDAVRTAKESFGFAYRIFIDGKVVKSGFCD